MLFAPTPGSPETFEIIAESLPADEPGDVETTQKRQFLWHYIEERPDKTVIAATVALDLQWETSELYAHLLALLDCGAVKCKLPSQTLSLRLKLAPKAAGKKGESGKGKDGEKRK